MAISSYSVDVSARSRGGRRRDAAAAWLIAVLALCWLPAAPVAAADFTAASADVRIVVDVSADMARADPDNLRGSALGLLLRALPDDGRAGVWTYGAHVNVLARYGRSDPLWKEVAAIQTAQLPSLASRANLLEAVDRASWDRASPDGPAHLVLVGDGRLEVSDDPEQNAAARARLLEQVAPELAEAGYRVHTLALSADADSVLLRGLSDATGGYHGRVAAPGALPRDLHALLGWIAGTASVEVDARGTFRVAPGTRELTLLKVGGAAAGNVEMVTPSGETLSPRTPRERVRWHLDRHYEMASLDRPAPGVWRLQGATQGVKVYAYGDLRMSYPDLPATLFPADLRSFELVLSSADGPVTDAAFLDLLNVSAQLKGPEQSVPVVVEAADDGRFRVHLQDLRGRGDYVLETRLQGPTFTHRLSLPFVLDNPVSVEIHPAEGGLLVWAQVRAHELDHDSLRMAALVRRPPAAARLVPVEKLPAGLWRAALDGAKGLLEITLVLRGNYLNGNVFESRMEPMRVVLPVTGVQYVDMDLRGRPLLAEALPEGAIPVTQPPPEPERATPPPAASQPAVDAELDVPVWFALLVGAGNLSLIMMLWWLLGTRGQFPDLAPGMDRLRKLADLHHPAAAGAP